MLRLSGKAVYKGIAVGPTVVIKKNDLKVKRVKITDAKQEIFRLEQAGEKSKDQLQRLYEKAEKEAGER